MIRSLTAALAAVLLLAAAPVPREFRYTRPSPTGGVEDCVTTCWKDCDNISRCFTSCWPVNATRPDLRLGNHRTKMVLYVENYPEAGSDACNFPLPHRRRPHSDFINPRKKYEDSCFPHIAKRVRNHATN